MFAIATIRKHIRKNGGITFVFQVKVKNPYTDELIIKTRSWRAPLNLPEKELEKMAILESDKFEKEIRSNIEKGMSNDSDITFYEFALRWLEKTYAETGLAYYERCKGVVEYVRPYIGKYKLKALNPTIIQIFYNMIDTRKKHVITIKPVDNFKEILISYGFRYKVLRNELGFQDATLESAYHGNNVSLKWAEKVVEKTGIPFKVLFIRKDEYIDYKYETNHQIKRVCRTIGGYAKKQRLIEDNYFSADYIDFPKRPKHQIKTMTDEEVIKFYDYLLKLPELKTSTPMILALMVGMRRGEIAGLKWCDIDFEKNKLSINRTLTTVNNHGVVEKSPKTNSSYRTITLPDEVMEQLKKYKEWQLSEIEKLGDFYNDEDWVFAQTNGKRIHPSTITHDMGKLCKRAGVNRCSVHSLRHTAATMMLMSGVSINVVAQRLGHARPSTSTDIYGYVLQTAEASAANATTDYLKSLANEKSKKEIMEIDEIDDVKKFREVKSEMERLGFEDYNEYLEYLDFKTLKEGRKKASS